MRCEYLIEFGFCMYYGDDCEDHPSCNGDLEPDDKLNWKGVMGLGDHD